jgi:hypothetical protein
MITYVGTTFSVRDQWGPQEVRLVKNIQEQIERRFSHQSNLMINLTWFGPQFNNNLYNSVNQLADRGTTFDNIFWMSSVDPIYLLPDQIAAIEKNLKIKQAYYIGGFEHSEHAFDFSSTATAEDFIPYSQDQMLLADPVHLYLCYNRKPRRHRIELVEKIYANNLEQYGIVTLGRNDVNYDVGQGAKTDLYLTVDETAQDYSHNNRFRVHKTFGGIPCDSLSLGRLDIWQTHFLNVVSETEFLPWDNRFVTEKTWKPILGLRPFVLNGQTKIYQYLRDQGFYTFNHYWPHIELENINESEVHDSIIQLIMYLKEFSKDQLQDLYSQMLPELLHNHKRFNDYANEQKNKINHLFEL